MYKYYIAAQTNAGLIAYVYNLNYKIDTEQGIKKNHKSNFGRTWKRGYYFLQRVNSEGVEHE